MKQTVWYALAASLLIIAGCKKGNDDSTEMMSSEEVAEKTHAAAVQTTEKAADVTAKAEEVTKEVTQKAEEAVASISVKAEEVMGDLNQSVEAIKEKVAEFDKTQLLAYVDQYKTLLLENKDQIAAMTEQVKALPMTELMGDKAKALKSQLAQYTDQFNALKERYTVYLDKLQEYGVDLSAYTL